MKNFYVWLVLMAFLLIGCSKEDGTDVGGPAVQLATGTTSEYTVYADETEVAPSQGITFTTTGPWRATVAETRAGTDWVTISPDHGDQAGSYTIRISLGTNTTGQDRKAVVTIECGDTRVAITIEQKAVTASGEQPQDPIEGGKRVSRVETDHYYHNGTEIVHEYNHTIDFVYDEQGRVSQMVARYYGGDFTEGYISTVSLTYGEGMVSYEIGTVENGVENPNKDNGAATLDGQGRVASGEYVFFEHKGDEWIRGGDTYELSYDVDGYLIRTVPQGGSSESHISWENGNPVQVWWGTSGGSDLIDKATYGEVLNRANVDLNWLCVLSSEGWDYAAGDPNKVFNIIGLIGTRALHMVQTLSESGVYDTPRTRSYTYQLDVDGLPVQIERVATGDYSSVEYADYTYKITYTE